MKEKRNCKIVQDLLPNYIEKLTNEETNYFIKEHLKECTECQHIFENMQKELKVNTEKRDDREVKYIKKYSRRIKQLRNILLIIVALFIVVVGRKTIILTNLSNKANDIKNQNNYYAKTETFEEGQMTILKSYNKDGITFGTMNIYSENDTKKLIFYKSKAETILLKDNGTTKTLSNTGEITINPVFFTGENILENLFIAMTTRVEKMELNGKECYLIKEGDTEKFIDVNTGLAIKMIDNQNNRTVDYKYEFGIVKDSDIEKPDTTGYTITE